MSAHLNRWSPDTCGCVIEYEWDDSVPDDQRVHTSVNIIKLCDKHTILGLDKVNHYSGVLDENRRKNKVHSQLLTISNMTETVTQDDGSQVVQFKKGIGFNFSWTGLDSARVLHISVFGYNLTNQQKSAVQNWCNTNLGIGKVVID